MQSEGGKGGLLFSSISLNEVHTEQIKSLEDDVGKHKDGTPLRNIRLENKIHKKMDEQLLQELLKGQRSLSFTFKMCV